MGWLSWRWSVVHVVLFASLLVLASAQQPPPPRPPRGSRGAPPEMSTTDVDATLARMCGGASSRPAAVPPLPLCHELRLRHHRAGVRRHHRRPAPVMPPPGRDEEVDVRYGVAKRLVPTGPNPLHN